MILLLITSAILLITNLARVTYDFSCKIGLKKKMFKSTVRYFNNVLPIYKNINFFLLLLSFIITATEIQNIQIGEGDVCRNILIPIHMIFPRLFTCPTLVTNNFKIGMFLIFLLVILLVANIYFLMLISSLLKSLNCTFVSEFEVNVVVVFEDEYIITENFPILIIRP